MNGRFPSGSSLKPLTQWVETLGGHYSFVDPTSQPCDPHQYNYVCNVTEIKAIGFIRGLRIEALTTKMIAKITAHSQGGGFQLLQQSACLPFGRHPIFD